MLTQSRKKTNYFRPPHTCKFNNAIVILITGKARGPHKSQNLRNCQHSISQHWTATLSYADVTLLPSRIQAVMDKAKTTISTVNRWSSTVQHTHNRFMALFLGPPWSAGARREPLDIMRQGKINRGTHTVWLGATPSRLISAHLHQTPTFTGRMPFLPPNQQCQRTEGN